MAGSTFPTLLLTELYDCKYVSLNTVCCRILDDMDSHMVSVRTRSVMVVLTTFDFSHQSFTFNVHRLTVPWEIGVRLPSTDTMYQVLL